MNIFLIGFMGSGKSTVGKKLAARLGYSFLDMDVEIEKEEGKPIATIFSEKGETYFRNLEFEWLRNFSKENNIVATGGGAPCVNSNLEKMKAKGITVYLKSSPENLAQRLFNARGSRPLIDHLKNDLAALTAFVESKLAERLPYYSQCDVIIDAINFDSVKLDELIALVNKKI